MGFRRSARLNGLGETLVRLRPIVLQDQASPEFLEGQRVQRVRVQRLEQETSGLRRVLAPVFDDSQDKKRLASSGLRFVRPAQSGRLCQLFEGARPASATQHRQAEQGAALDATRLALDDLR